MSVIKVGDFIVLDEDINFVVVATTEYEGSNYLYGFKAPEVMGDVFNSKNLENAFLKEIIEETSQECFVEEVVDDKLVKILTNKIVTERVNKKSK